MTNFDIWRLGRDARSAIADHDAEKLGKVVDALRSMGLGYMESFEWICVHGCRIELPEFDDLLQEAEMLESLG